MMTAKLLTGLVAATTLGYTGLSLLPLLIGASAEQLILSEAQQAMLASSDIGGLALGAVLSYAAIGRVVSKRLLEVSLVLLAGCSIAAPFTEGFAALCAVRFALEISAGIMTALMFVRVGQTAEPLRVFAYCTAAVMAQSLLLFTLLPPLLAGHGVLVVHLTQLLAVVVLGPLVLFVPTFGAGPRRGSPTEGYRRALVMRVLGALACFWAAEGVLWAFMERLGVSSGLSATDTGRVMALAMVTSLAGALLAAWMAGRWGRHPPLLLGIAGFASACVGFVAQQPLAFAVALTLSQLCFSLVLPYLLELCTECDAAGRSVALTPAVNNIGQALGPLTAAPLLAAGGYVGVVWVALPMLLLTAWLAGPPARLLDASADPQAQTKV